MELALAAAFGLLIGSFLNVCIYRLPRDLSVVQPRSRCPHCDLQIAWFDNLPVASFLLLGGRCRHCRSRISIRYPIVELLTAVLFALAVDRWGVTLPAAKQSLFGALMLVLAFADLETRLLPDQVTKGGFWLGLLLSLPVPVEPGLMRLILSEASEPVASLADALFAAAFGAGSIWTVGVLYQRIRGREGLGFGDVKMIAMTGAFLGLPKTFLTLILGSVGGSVLGLLYILLAKKKASTYQLPFGTFLGAAGIAVAFFTNGPV